MAKAPLLQNGLGNIDLPPIVKDLDPALALWFRKLAERINGLLSLGNASQFTRVGNLDAQYLPWTFSTVDTDEIIPHGLNRVPVGYLFCDRSVSAGIYAPNHSGWTDSVIVLRSTVSGLVTTLIVW